MRDLSAISSQLSAVCGRRKGYMAKPHEHVIPRRNDEESAFSGDYRLRKADFSLRASRSTRNDDSRCFGSSVPKRTSPSVSPSATFRSCIEGQCRRLASILVILIVLALLPISGSAGTVTKILSDGVIFTQTITPDGPDVMVVNVLKIDTTNKNVKVESALAGGTVIEGDPTNGRETISHLTERTGVLAAVNADYFPYTGDPLGVAIVNGDLVSEPFDGRSAMGISLGGWVLFDKLTFSGWATAANGVRFRVRGINRLRGPNEMICYTPTYGAVTPNRNECTDVTLSGVTLPLPPNKPVEAVVNCIAPGPGSLVPPGCLVLSGNGLAAKFINDNLHVGDKVTLRFDLMSQFGKNWTPVVQAVGGGPFLVVNSEVAVGGDAEKFSASLIRGRHPRTAVGMTADKQLLLVTVDGRQWISRGMTLQELAELMKSLGAVTAINLDGGGSTTMSIKGLVVNSPSDGIERSVADALVVKTIDPPVAPTNIRFEVPSLSVQVGAGQKLALINCHTGLPLDQAALARVVYGTRGGKGFVNQSGLFVPLRTGNGTVVALLGDRRAELPVTVTTGPPFALTASLKDDPAGVVGRGLVQVAVSDKGDNPIAGVKVSLSVAGGTADVVQTWTDALGAASVPITWDPASDPAKRSVTVSVEGLPAQTVKYTASSPQAPKP